MEASELNQILDQHKLWIDGKGGKRANLGGEDLYGANLTGAILWGANLSRANLRGANLTGANLWGANLIDASFFYGNLGGANLGGANLEYAKLTGADLTGADLQYANLEGANLWGANLWGATGLPNVSWIIPGCLVHLNNIKYEFYLKKEEKYENFVQDSFGFFIQDNPIEKTFDMLVEDRIMRNIPDWVKYSGLKKAS